MGLNLSDKELDAMDGLPHLQRCLYIFGIRRYMDYSTGITGIKRKISYKSLSEEIYVYPRQGIKEIETRSIPQLKRAVKQLEKAGLIIMQSKVTKDEKQLILKCPLALTDNYVQNKAVPRPYQSPVREAVPEIYNTEKEEKLYNNSIINPISTLEEKQESRTETRTTQNQKAALHPLSGKDTKLNYTKLSADYFLSTAENKFLNLFTDLKLSVNLAGDLKALTTAKALVQAGVSIQEAREALEIKLAAYKGTRTPHPSYFKQAILDYKRDLETIKQQQSEVTPNETNQPRAVNKPRITHEQRRKRLAEWAEKKQRELEEGSESDSMAI